MDKYKSRWKDKDMRVLEEENKLYEIVKYYGGYRWYCENVNEGAFYAYYNLKNESMKNIFINTANAEAKKYFDKVGISGRKMRKLLITGKGKSPVSYEWISDYADYILGKCLEEPSLKNKVLEIMHIGCVECVGRSDSEELKMLCTRRLLGFQYTLLLDVSNRGFKNALSAKNNIRKMEKSEFIQDCITSCETVIKGNE